MYMNRFFTIILAGLLLSILTARAGDGDAGAVPGTNQINNVGNLPLNAAYEPNWKSLSDHDVPEWLQDAKFGIYAHWGVYSVPAYFNEWYPRYVYEDRHPVQVEHTRRYGPPTEFGYKDLAPLFTADKFDAAEWADLIAESGARYAGIAVVHHDGYALWASDLGRWDVGDIGPKRDVYGELVTELRARDLKIISTFHQFRQFDWYLTPEMQADEDYARGTGYDLFDPANKEIYWNRYVATFDEFIDFWKARVNEVIKKYQPDVLWFDGGKFRQSGKEGDILELLAGYFNHASTLGKEVEVLNKLPSSMKWNFPRSFGALTYEEGRDRPGYVDKPWIDDLKVSAATMGWGYLEGQTYLDPDEVIDGLIDRVARNGGLLLSLSPKADGTLPAGQKHLLREMGAWLKVNGEAIYATRPWKTHAEGAVTKFIQIQVRDTGDLRYKWKFAGADAQDIRFTTRGDRLFALFLGWPEDKLVLINSLRNESLERPVSGVRLLGHEGRIGFSMTEVGLQLELPETPPNPYAYVFEILQ
jgi:alpha-L-fucosidase